jgi:hypothetical protein
MFLDVLCLSQPPVDRASVDIEEILMQNGGDHYGSASHIVLAPSIVLWSFPAVLLLHPSARQSSAVLACAIRLLSPFSGQLKVLALLLAGSKSNSVTDRGSETIRGLKYIHLTHQSAFSLASGLLDDPFLN